MEVLDKMNKESLLKKAKKILDKNWRNGYTVPSPYLYPHQWSWDSAFISIGYSNYDIEKAKQELLSMFVGQWKTGMLPHIIFRSEGEYFPNPEYWNIIISENAPENVKTSGITQPPVHSIAALEIYRKSDDKENAKKFLEIVFPKLMSFHGYLLSKRDPEKSGLVTIFHPWESGFDNSLRWDDALDRIEPAGLPEYNRIDNKKINAGQRPTDKKYDRFIYLIEIMKKVGYDDEKVYTEIPFKIKDISFSSILYVANHALKKIAKILGKNNTVIKSWIKRTKKNYFGFFSRKGSKDRLIYDYDIVEGKLIEKKTVASLLPLYTDLLRKGRVKDMLAWINHAHFCTENCIHDHKVVSSMSYHDKGFNPLNYWRGPNWININWMLYKGLNDRGLKEDAKKLKEEIIQLVEEHGFYEYYNPITSEGLGANNFSWTAALVIDLLMEND